MPAIDLGDGVDLTWKPTDAAGNPADVGAAALTITLPDGTVVTPAVTHVGLGNYAPTTNPFVTTQAGRHAYTWVGTGANAQAYQDTFDVLGADANLIISLAEARKGLRTPAGQTVDDDDLRELIAACTAPIEDICGPVIQRTFDEWHDGGGQTVRLLRAPAVSITSVIEAYGAGYTRALTLQNLDSGSFDAFGYTVDLQDAILTRRTAGTVSTFAGGRRNIHVVYVAGRNPIPQNILRATRRLVRYLQQKEMQGGARPAGGGTQPEVIVRTANGYEVPADVLALCAGDVHVPGIA